MRKSLVVLAVLAALVASDRAFAEDHLVTSAAAGARLAEAEAARQGDLAVLDGVLCSPEAAAAAKAVGADLDDVRGATPTLTDAELRDLAARAAALQADPVAGVSDHDLRWLLYIFLLVAIVILVLKAVD
jgi:Skp family chaperone for outer membrane proteins